MWDQWIHVLLALMTVLEATESVSLCLRLSDAAGALVRGESATADGCGIGHDESRIGLQ